ncbi:DUF4258 domain-containing protein [Jiella sp. M17.18]|uniref:DUF4258 domain-containing protein n=1 Tax=Jiella sp. M17.18 TaxID=3234247 RepID=UPI0034DF04DC
MILKPVVFTLHARAKIAERRIEAGWIETAVRNPEWVQPEPRDANAERRFGSVAAFGGRILRVVCVETASEIRIVTATFDRGPGDHDRYDLRPRSRRRLFLRRARSDRPYGRGWAIYL